MISRRGLLAAGLAVGVSGPVLAQSRVAVGKIRLENGRVNIDTTLGGKGPFNFVMDTGAVVSGISPTLAARLGLKKVRDVRLAGKVFPLYLARDAVFGGAVGQPEIGLFGLSSELRGGDGLLAAGLMTSTDSELDFDRLEWRVHPDGLADRPGFTEVESSIDDLPDVNGSHLISATVKVNGQPVRLIVDTGAPRAVSLRYDVGRRLGLWAEDKPFSPAPLHGIGGVGADPGRTIRAARLDVGPVGLDGPLVTVRPAKAVNFADYEGILGLPAIQRMNLSVDTKRRKLFVRRNGRDTGIELLSRTGLWLDEDRGGAKVRLVSPGSPGAAAGLKPGDRIAGNSTFGALLARVNGGPSSLQVTDATGVRTVNLTPADYL